MIGYIDGCRLSFAVVVKIVVVAFALTAAAIGALALSGAFDVKVEVTDGSDAPARRFVVGAAAVRKASGASLAEYSELRVGMSYRRACDIIGGAGVEVSRAEFGGVTTVMYQWWGERGGGANMNAMFQDDRLVTKAQSGLR